MLSSNPDEPRRVTVLVLRARPGETIRPAAAYHRAASALHSRILALLAGRRPDAVRVIDLVPRLEARGQTEAPAAPGGAA